MEELKLILIKGLKILLVYILPSVLIAVAVSPELRSVLEDNPKLAVYAPVINIGLITLATEVKKRIPEDSKVQKIL